MAISDLTAALMKIGMDEDLLDSADRLVVLKAAQLLGVSTFKLLHDGYKTGFCDAIVRGTRSTNIHMTANYSANAFALSIMKGIKALD